MRKREKTKKLAALLAAAPLMLAACGGDDSSGGGGGSLSGSIRTDGSSTVGPLTEAAAEAFQGENSGVRVTVGTSGTGGGFEKFCAKETDVSNASRPIKDDEEVPVCEKNGVEFQELQIANDGITLVVNPENDWAECLTVDQLETIWEKGSKIKSWRDVDPKFPDEEIALFGAGTDSGTFDFFTDAINGEEGNSRTDYNATEDDNVTVQGVAGEKGALGYYGLEYAEQNADKNKKVEVDSGAGCVEPTKETVQSGEYKPLSRPLFIYPSKQAAARPEVKAFLEFYLQNVVELADQAQFVPMTEEQRSKAEQTLEALGGGA
ncbi:MAG TPA: PstS family phosphate ABC transporter substrate-binding protein [Thermoleophilaceae bacterium]|jgi:phosphate transport system substrate-binding protein